MIPVCPKCDEALFLLEFHEIEVDLCPKCRGLWLDAEELEDLLRATGGRPAPIPMNPASSASKALCPRCDQALQAVHPALPGGEALELETCPRGHGFWFDARELRALLRLLPPDMAAEPAAAFLDDMLGKAANPVPASAEVSAG